MDFCSGHLLSVSFANNQVKKGADVMCRCNISSEIPAAKGYVRTKLSSSSAQLCVRYGADRTTCVAATSFKDVPVKLATSGSTEIYLKSKQSLPSGVLTVYGFGESIIHLAQLIGPMAAREDGTLVIHWPNDIYLSLLLASLYQFSARVA